VRLHNGVGHQVRQFGHFAFAGFDGVQRCLRQASDFGMVLVI
jgi:hypothetical protein